MAQCLPSGCVMVSLILIENPRVGTKGFCCFLCLVIEGNYESILHLKACKGKWARSQGPEKIQGTLKSPSFSLKYQETHTFSFFLFGFLDFFFLVRLVKISMKIFVLLNNIYSTLIEIYGLSKIFKIFPVMTVLCLLKLKPLAQNFLQKKYLFTSQYSNTKIHHQCLNNRSLFLPK